MLSIVGRVKTQTHPTIQLNQLELTSCILQISVKKNKVIYKFGAITIPHIKPVSVYYKKQKKLN